MSTAMAVPLGIRSVCAYSRAARPYAAPAALPLTLEQS